MGLRGRDGRKARQGVSCTNGDRAWRMCDGLLESGLGCGADEMPVPPPVGGAGVDTERLASPRSFPPSASGARSCNFASRRSTRAGLKAQGQSSVVVCRCSCSATRGWHAPPWPPTHLAPIACTHKSLHASPRFTHP
eukprot:362094-Chlamydomonas_euryale.AAC.6